MVAVQIYEGLEGALFAAAEQPVNGTLLVNLQVVFEELVGDVAADGLVWGFGVAFVPEKEYEDMDDSEKKNMFDGPKTERVITPEMRQLAFDNYATTDDHGMHIIGMAMDQTGRKYYKVKNSWGAKNDYKGYIYVTSAFVQYKTTAILLHKEGIPGAIKKQLSI